MNIRRFKFCETEVEVSSLKGKDGTIWLHPNSFGKLLGFESPREAVRLYVSKRNQRWLRDGTQQRCDNRYQRYQDTATTPGACSSGGGRRFYGGRGDARGSRGKVNVQQLHYTPVINKFGLYELIGSSRVSFRREFRYWVNNILFAELIDEAVFVSTMDEDADADYGDDSKNRRGIGIDSATSGLLDDDSRRHFEDCCVYVATNERLKRTHLYHVSATTDLRKRLEELNYGSPFDFYIVEFRVTTKVRYFRERICERLNECHVGRQFFKITNDTLQEILRFFRGDDEALTPKCLRQTSSGVVNVHSEVTSSLSAR